MFGEMVRGTPMLRSVRAARIGAAVGMLVTAVIGYTQVLIDLVLGHPWGWNAGFTDPTVAVVHGIVIPTVLLVSAWAVSRAPGSWVAVMVPSFTLIGVGAISYFQWDVRQSEIISVAQLFPAVLCAAYVFHTRWAWVMWAYAFVGHGLAVMLSPDVLDEAGDWAVVHTLLAGLVMVITRLRDMEALGHEALERAVQTDALTGVRSRAAFEEILAGAVPVAWDEASSDNGGHDGAGATMLVVDVDQFKAINDRWGHPAGDAALQQVACLLSGVASKDAVVCRTGGDEFVVFLPPLDSSKRADVVHAIETSAQGAGFMWGDERKPLRLSVGSATGAVGPVHGVRLYAEADAAMLEAKSAHHAEQCSSHNEAGREAAGEAEEVCRG